MSDYELKAKVLELGLDKVYKRSQIYEYFYCARSREDFNDLPLDYAISFECIQYLRQFEEGSKEFLLLDEARKVSNATHSRNKRLRKKIMFMLCSGECMFLTLTFDDNCLDKTSADTRRKYVSRYLKAISEDYVGNIDFGKLNEREHYHAVIKKSHLNLEEIHSWSCSYGNLDYKKIPIDWNTDDVNRITHYVNKLTNHAIKETCKRNTLIYPKKKK